MPYSIDQNMSLINNVVGDMVPKAARTVTGDSGWIPVGAAKELIVQLDAAAGAGTTPTLDVKLQTSFNGTDAAAMDVPNGAFAQVAGAASMQIKSVTAFHRFVKVVWTIGGATPSFNFGVYATGRN